MLFQQLKSKTVQFLSSRKIVQTQRKDIFLAFLHDFFTFSINFMWFLGDSPLQGNLLVMPAMSLFRRNVLWVITILIIIASSLIHCSDAPKNISEIGVPHCKIGQFVNIVSLKVYALHFCCHCIDGFIVQKIPVYVQWLILCSNICLF